jgi:hypothetical protein
MKSKFVVLLAAMALTLLASNGSQAAGMAETCGGFFGKWCEAGQFCQFKTGVCGRFDQTGTCARVPQLCPAIVLPVCGCNNVTYNNDCERERAMVSKLHNGRCT